MNLVRSLRQRSTGITFDEWLSYFTYGGLSYPFMPRQTLTGNEEQISGDFSGLVQGAYKSNGVVFACMLVRQLLFSEARFSFRQFRAGRPGNLFGTPALRILERPQRGQTTGSLLSRAIQDADIAGNFFGRRSKDRIVRLRPDWTTIVLGSQNDPDAAAWDLDAEVLGYIYRPGGPSSSKPVVPLLAEQVAHWAPIPDPVSPYRGMSWLEPIIREILADGAATQHKLKFFEQGATPNMIVTFDSDIGEESVKRWMELFEQGHSGAANAYKTMYMAGGAKADVVGSNFRQIDFKVTQGAGETRIAAAAGVPPIIVGLSEGLQAATYSNYGQARRRFADGTMRPLWRSFAAAMANIIDVPEGAELWYDDRDISFLQEDQKDAAEIQQVQASAIKSLVDAGFEADAVVDAVTSGDLSRLVHTGLFSVQLQPAGTTLVPKPEPEE